MFDCLVFAALRMLSRLAKKKMFVSLSATASKPVTGVVVGRYCGGIQAASVVWSPNSLGVVVGGQVVFPVCEEELNATG